MSRAVLRLAASVVIATLLACQDQAPDITPAAIEIAPATVAAIASGTTVALHASVTTARGSPLDNLSVEWLSDDPTVVSVSSSGVVTGVGVGDAHVTASVGGVHSTPVAVTVVAGAATQLVIRTQPDGAASGARLTTQPVIEIRDAAGNLVTSSSETVTATIATGGGTLAGSTTTASGGVAAFTSLAVSGTAGDRTLSFSVSGLPAATSSGFALVAGPPAKLVVRTEPTGAVSGLPLRTQPVVELRDDADNLVTSSDLVISAAVAAGGGTLAHFTAPVVAGVASFDALTITGTATSHTLVFSASGVASVTSAPFLVSPGQATALRIRTQPGGATSGRPLATQPVIEVVDAAGNLVPSATPIVTAAIETGGGKLTNLAVAAVGGVATFTSLGVSAPAVAHTISFSAPDLTSVTSASFAVAPGAATQLVILQAPSSTPLSGVVFAQQPIVGAADDAGNRADYNGQVIASVSNNSVTITGNVANMVNGVASFQGMRVTGPVGPLVIAFSAAGLSSAGVGISIPSGPPVRLAIVIAPALTQVSGSRVAPSPAVRVVDANGNPVPMSITITMVTDAISGTITNGSVATATGEALFTNLVLTGPPGARNYQFTAPGLSPTPIIRITLTQ